MTITSIKQQYAEQLTLRRKYAYTGLIIFVLSVGLLVLVEELRAKPWFFIVIGFAVLNFIVGIVGLNYWSRCPACKKVPRNKRDGSISFGAMDKCPSCEVDLT